MTLNGLNLLLVEDDMLILEDIKVSLEREGAQVVTATSVAAGLEASQNKFDTAILDIRLGDGEVFPVAEQLAAQQTPIIFHSAVTDQPHVKRAFPNAVALSKPVRDTILINTVIKVAKGQ